MFSGQEGLVKEIQRLRRKHNAVIVAHNYQRDEVQELADVVGDSFALSRYCADSPADVIVFCGVHFMAESAKILSPQKTVLLPERDAVCPMADMVTAEALRKKKEEVPDAVVVCYVNTSAETKAESDICCTSSNAVNVVRSLSQKRILFVPDKNLGRYLAKKVPEKEFIFWEGFCPTHDRLTAPEVTQAKGLHPDAKVLVHPECREEVIAQADFVGSTKGIIDYARTSDAKEFIIATEMGVLYQMKRDNPGKRFFLISPTLVCPNMKKISLESIYYALSEMRYEVNVQDDIRERAYGSLERMLKV